MIHPARLRHSFGAISLGRVCGLARFLVVGVLVANGASLAQENRLRRVADRFLRLPLPVIQARPLESTVRIGDAPLSTGRLEQTQRSVGDVSANASVQLVRPAGHTKSSGGIVLLPPSLSEDSSPEQALRRIGNTPEGTAGSTQSLFRPTALLDSSLFTNVSPLPHGEEVAVSAVGAGKFDEPLPPLAEELQRFGGSSLYEAESELRSTSHGHAFEEHVKHLRLPESIENSQPPVTAYQDFLGADPIAPWTGLKWFGDEGFQWEPRFVTHGSYEVFGLFLEQGGTRQDIVGHQLIVDLDLRLTGTERAHVQFRPLGRRNTGGSFFQLDDPTGYDDNSTGIPDRWWIEGEFNSLFAGLIDDDFTPLDYHITVGKVPYAVHNSLLINDEVTGVIVNKNTFLIPPLSNLNLQGFYFFDDVDTATPHSTELVGMHASADWRNAFIEGTVAYVSHSDDNSFDSRYAAISATQFFGPITVAGRALFKGGDEARTGDGALFVAESNLTRAMPHEVSCHTGIDHAVIYGNFFKATSGWSPISGANFNRLRSTFSVDPLVRIGQGLNPADTVGASIGVQLFRDHEDESFTPEVAWEQPQGDSVWGVGLRWQRKLGPQIYLDAAGIVTWSDNPLLEREGLFVSTFVVF